LNKILESIKQWSAVVFFNNRRNNKNVQIKNVQQNYMTIMFINASNAPKNYA